MKVLIIVFMILCFLGNSLLFAQWDEDPTYQEYVGHMEKWQQDYPDLAKLHELGPAGATNLNHNIYALQLSDNVSQEEQEPSFLYTGTLHGDETLALMLSLRLIDTMLLSYGKDSLITRLINNIDIWFAPLCNPDGTYPRGDNTVQYAQRYNVANRWDLMRNFPCPCGEGNHQYYGVYGYASEEVKAIRKCIEANNFVISADIHGGTEVVIWPWCYHPKAPPDLEWFRFISKDYVDTVYYYCNNNGYMTSVSDSGYRQCCNESMYTSHGMLIDYMNYYRHCKGITLELSVRKNLLASDLQKRWEWNYRSLLYLLSQVLNGIQGTVTDTISGEPLNAKVFIVGHDNDSSHVFSHLPHGDYYRPVFEGTYDITFSCNGYYPKTINVIHAETNIATVLNVKLRKIQTNIIIDKHNINVYLKNNRNSATTIEIYDLMGRKIKTIPANAPDKWQAGKGIYVVRFVGDGFVNRKVVYVK
jgi:hypothetical protein